MLFNVMCSVPLVSSAGPPGSVTSSPSVLKSVKVE